MPRVTKEILKGNELIVYIQGIVGFFKKYWEKMKIGLLIGGVAALFITLLILGNVRTNASAIGEFNSALAICQNQQVPAQERYTKARDAFKSLLDRYPRSNIKYEALFYLGNCHYFLGEYDEAIEAFTKCAAKMKKGSLGIYALQGIGKSNEGKGNYSESLQVYQKVLDKYPNHFLKANIEIDIGRCYEKLGKVNEAVNTYQKILDFSPQSPWAREAKIRINMLKG